VFVSGEKGLTLVQLGEAGADGDRPVFIHDSIESRREIVAATPEVVLDAVSRVLGGPAYAGPSIN